MAPTTTSATRPGPTRRRPGKIRRPPRRAGPRPPHAGTGPGFTLVEVVLAVALVVVLVSMGIIALGRWYDTGRLPEGARRLESILRMARADACARGRRVQFGFDGDTLQPAITWEPKPLEEPGQFLPHPGVWAHDLPAEDLRVIRCERRGSDAMRVLTYGDGRELTSDEGNVLQAVTFYPDGSFDSAILEVAGRNESELRVGRIDLDGVSGKIELRILTPMELEEQLELDAEAEGQ